MNKPTHNNKQLDPDYIKKEQEKTMKEWFGDKGYEALDKMVKQRKGTVRITCQTCPNCYGQGIVSEPPHFPGTVYEEIEDSSASYYSCNLCHGDGIIVVLK